MYQYCSLSSWNSESLEEQLLQCLLYAIFFLVFFSSYFSCVNPRFLESCFSFLWFFFKHFENFCSNYSIIWKTFKDLTDPTKPNMIDTIQIKASGSNNEVYYWMCSENFRKYLKKHTVKKIILKYSKNHPR